MCRPGTPPVKQSLSFPGTIAAAIFALAFVTSPDQAASALFGYCRGQLRTNLAHLASEANLCVGSSVGFPNQVKNRLGIDIYVAISITNARAAQNMPFATSGNSELSVGIAQTHEKKGFRVQLLGKPDYLGQ